MGNYLKLSDQTGVSLIATVLTLLIFALFIAIAVSLVTTGSNISLQEEQGTQSFFIADGGLQYAATLPFPNAAASSINLGSGSFTTSVPTLQTALPNNNNPVASITVSSTDGFLQASPPSDTNYWIMLCDTAGNPTPDLNRSSICEKLSFTGKTPTPSTFTTGTRPMDNSAFAAHASNAVVLMYTWDTNKSTTLNSLLSNCNPGACVICVNNDPLTRGFTNSGFIRINDATANKIEDVFYTGTGNTTGICGAGCTACFTGGARNAFNSNGNGGGNDHASGTTVYQSEISVLATSTGTITNILSGNVTRRVQGALSPLQ